MAHDAQAPIALDAMTVDTAGIDAQLAVVLSYDGAPFCGFARQPGKETVQGDIERAFSLALRRPVEVVCAGRTDAGVHARGQVVSFPVTRDEVGRGNLARLKRSFQALTDDAISIQTLSVMPPEFSARFSAVEREYRYLIMPAGRHPLFLRDWCWDVRRPLDVDAMNAAAALLEGEHDFKSFCLAASAAGKNTVRTLREVKVVPVNVMGEDALSVRVVGTAFLHSMVRSIVGTLTMVGSGLREPAWVGDVLAARNRSAAGENAPAKGLVFWRVSYRGGIPAYEQDVLAPEDGAYRIPAADAPTGELRGITDRDVALAQAFERALEECEGDSPLAADEQAASSASRVFSDAALSAPLPEAVVRAAATRIEGSVRVNDTGGEPAIPAAPRTKHVAPADPQPAEGEASICFELHRESAAARAVKAQKEAHATRRRGPFAGLFRRKGNGDA